MMPLHASAEPRAADPTRATSVGGGESRGAPEDATRERRRGGVGILLLILLLGASIRAWIVLTPGLGHQPDINDFLEWTRGLVERGIGPFLESDSFCNYPPLWLLVLWVVGQLPILVHGALGSDFVLTALIKTPACLADLAIAILLFLEGRRLLGAGRAAAAAALYFLNPLTLYHSAFWGQVDSVHAAFCLLSLVLVNRRRWGWAGAAAALGILQKLQAVAFWPLLILEVYRHARFRGLGVFAVGAVVVTALVILPFAMYSVHDDVVNRGYVRVVGQYTDLSKNAYNLWYVIAKPNWSDASPPSSIARIVAAGRDHFPEDESPLMRITWRRISLSLYALVVAIILSLYSLRPGAVNRFGAAGLLGLAFFLFPTEMHERYALPALAFLPLWAVRDGRRERAYFLLSALLLLNVSAVEPAGPMAKQIAATNLVLFAVMLIGAFRVAKDHGEPDGVLPEVLDRPTPPSLVIGSFRLITAIALSGFVGASVWLAHAYTTSLPPSTPVGTTYLDTLTAKHAQQGWGELQINRSVAGGLIRLGSECYVRGVGTHAPSRLVYAIPADYENFEAMVGINRSTQGKGSVKVAVDLDGKEVFASETLTGVDQPLPVRISLSGAKVLTLRADPTPDDQKADHVDWALARFTR